MKKLFILFFTLAAQFAFAQTTNLVVLNDAEIQRVRDQIDSNSDVNVLYNAFLQLANEKLELPPHPVEIIHYEGLLDNNPLRVKTVESFADIDYVVALIYAGYGSDNPAFGKKAKEIILAWAEMYKPDGNPINENKFNAFYWGYYLFKNYFNKQEQETVENWMLKIAELEMNRTKTPNNNWEAKRCKIIGIIGCILNHEKLKDYAVNHFKKYISSAYFADGTSTDLMQRDALSYHVSGLKPCVSASINLAKFDNRFNLFDFVSDNGSSLRKSVEYVVPYATGEQQRKEWTNTKEKLDKERAAAGLPEYQPGKFFEPEKAYELFEFACFYHDEWKFIFEKDEKISSWIGFLNSDTIRK